MNTNSDDPSVRAGIPVREIRVLSGLSEPDYEAPNLHYIFIKFKSGLSSCSQKAVIEEVRMLIAMPVEKEGNLNTA